MVKKFQPQGQSVTEFTLVAPVLFLIIFCVIQLAYLAYVQLAVQRASLAIAREASCSNNPASYDPSFQLGYCLSTLGSLNKAALATVLATKCSISTDGTRVHVLISYPMPIWVPLAGNIFGQKLSLDSPGVMPMESSLQNAFKILGKPVPNFSFGNFNVPYIRYITYSADAVDENSIHSGD
jgi:hypothetical protein